MFLTDKLQVTSKRTYTDEGFLSVPARIGRTGIQEYRAGEMGLSDRNANDSIKVYRPEEEVFSGISLMSFANKPVTNNHPPELLDSTNAKKYSVGMSDRDVVRDGDFVTTTLVVTDAEAIADIESGKAELSNGYLADIDWVQGTTPDGQIYDAIQKNIKGNHIAIVTRGRAGFQCRVADQSPKLEETHTMKITIKGVDYEVSDQAAQAVGTLISDNKALKDQMSEEEEKKKKEEDAKKEKETEEKAKLDSLQAKLDDAISKVPTAETMDALVVARQDLIAKATSLCPTLDWTGKDEAAIMVAVVADQCPKVQMDSASPEYIATRFQILTEDVDTTSVRPLDAVFKNTVIGDKGIEDSRPAHVIAREKMCSDSRDAWKPKK